MDFTNATRIAKFATILNGIEMIRLSNTNLNFFEAQLPTQREITIINTFLKSYYKVNTFDFDFMFSYTMMYFLNGLRHIDNKNVMHLNTLCSFLTYLADYYETDIMVSTQPNKITLGESKIWEPYTKLKYILICFIHYLGTRDLTISKFFLINIPLILMQNNRTINQIRYILFVTQYVLYEIYIVTKDKEP